MTIPLALDKPQAMQIVKLQLDKTPSIKLHSADVVLCLDKSGSMFNKLHLIDPIMKLMIMFAHSLDSNGKLRYYQFSSDLKKMDELSIDDFSKHHSISHGGGTATHLCIDNEIPSKTSGMFSSFFGKKPEKKVIFIITDGEPDDEMEVIKSIAKAASHDIFIQFICLGKVALLEGETSPNVDTKKFPDLSDMTPEKFASKVISDDLAKFLSK
jgi:uncharacterized protein with von Willebrand factor type A (vWA) domain